MTTTVHLSITGRGPEDAPLLDDLLDQLRDFAAIVEGVAASVAGGGPEQFEWQVVGLSKNSPATVTLEAVPRPNFPAGAEFAAECRNYAAAGLQALQDGADRPAHFTDNVLDAVERFTRRHVSGLRATSIDFDGSHVLLAAAQVGPTVDHIAAILEGDSQLRYQEIGSFEGFIQNVGADGWGRPYIIVRSRLNGHDVKCFLSAGALKALEQTPVADVVWRNRRVSAFGILRSKALGRLVRAEISRLDFLSSEDPLPGPADIIDPKFTAGLGSAEYIERLRSGDA